MFGPCTRQATSAGELRLLATLNQWWTGSWWINIPTSSPLGPDISAVCVLHWIPKSQEVRICCPQWYLTWKNTPCIGFLPFPISLLHSPNWYFLGSLPTLLAFEFLSQSLLWGRTKNNISGKCWSVCQTKCVVLNKGSQTQKASYCMIPFIRHSRKGRTVRIDNRSVVSRDWKEGVDYRRVAWEHFLVWWNYSAA